MLQLMRPAALSLFAIALTACAGVETPTVAVAPTAPAASAPSPSRGAQLLVQAGRANAPARADIERVFGAADIARQDGAGAALTYRLNTCALLLVFTADTHNVMRLADAHASARRAGQAAPTLDQCAAEAEARRPS